MTLMRTVLSVGQLKISLKNSEDTAFTLKIPTKDNSTQQFLTG